MAMKIKRQYFYCVTELSEAGEFFRSWLLSPEPDLPKTYIRFIKIKQTGSIIDALAKKYCVAKQNFRPAKLGCFSGAKAYIG